MKSVEEGTTDEIGWGVGGGVTTDELIWRGGTTSEVWRGGATDEIWKVGRVTNRFSAHCSMAII